MPPFSSLLASRPAKGLVAIDVTPVSVAAIRVRSDRSDLVLEAWETALRDGHTERRGPDEPVRSALALRKPGDAVAVSITHPDTEVRRLELPPMSRKELRQALPFEASREIAGLEEDALLDAQVLREPSNGPMEVLLVAIPRRLYAEVEGVLARQGVTPEFVDVGQLAALNALRDELPDAAGRPGRPGLVASLELELTVGAFAVFGESDLVVFRDLDARAARLADALADAFKLDTAALAHLLASDELPGKKPFDAAPVRKALADVVTDLADDVRAGFLYVENTTGTALDRVYATGAAVRFLERAKLLDKLADQAGVPIEVFDPTEAFRRGILGERDLALRAPQLAAATGIALRYFGRS